MRLPSKPVWMLIAVHTLCLAVGFWFLHQLVNSLTEYQAVESRWDELAFRSTRLARQAESLNTEDLTPESTAPLKLETVALEIPNSDQLGIVLVDRNLAVIRPLTSNTDWKSGDQLTWQFEHNKNSAGGPARGRVATPQGTRSAIRYPVAEANGFLVVYDFQLPTPYWRGMLLTTLPMAAGIAFLWTWILSSVGTYLMSSRLNLEESSRKTQQEHEALRSAQDLLRTRDAVIFGLAKLAESRDPETGHHLERISLYSTRLATAMRSIPKYQRTVTPGFVRLLGISSVLHDIGKVGLEDTVLLKPGKLDVAERKRMQEHTLVAGACLREIEQRLGASNFLQTAREIALHHHERWDGNGYPTGLAGAEIPLSARIVTVADVYDALSSKRVYKEAFPHEECVRLIREGSGTQFDPELVQIFLSIEAEFAEIARRFAAASKTAADKAAATAEGACELMSQGDEAVLLDIVTGSASADSSNRSTSVA